MTIRLVKLGTDRIVLKIINKDGSQNQIEMTMSQWSWLIANREVTLS